MTKQELSDVLVYERLTDYRLLMEYPDQYFELVQKFLSMYDSVKCQMMESIDLYGKCKADLRQVKTKLKELREAWQPRKRDI